MQVSGRLVIIGIVGLALTGACASWWFRYAATHRAAEFWGPQASVLIREATFVELIELSPIERDTKDAFGYTVVLGEESFEFLRRHDISAARGLVHLRHALLDDRSFVWPSRVDIPSADWRWGLRFSEPESAPLVLHQTVWLTSDGRLMAVEQRGGGTGRSISCEPIADGLTTMFSELTRRSGETH
jgi:hypothetical protein